MLSRRDALLYLLLLTMEMLGAFALLVGSSLLDLVSIQYAMFWVLLGSAVAGLLVALVAGRLAPALPGNRVVILGGAAAGAGVPALLMARNGVSFFVTLLILLLAYWRGLSLTAELPGHDDVLRRFGFGFGMLFFGLIWIVARGIDHQQPIWHMMAFVGIAYTAVTLVALGLARVERVREPGAGQAIVLAIAIQIGVVLVVGLLAIQIFSFDVVGPLMHRTQGLWDALGATLFNVVTLVASPVQHVIDLLRPTGSQGRKPSISPPPARQPFGRRPKHPPQAAPSVTIALVVIGILILLGVAYLIWRRIPHVTRRYTARPYTEERESLSWRETLGLFLAWLRALFRRGADTAAEAMRTGRQRLFGDLPDDQVRRTYVRLLRRAAGLGVEREPGMTPIELDNRLGERWPAGAADFRAITQTYIRRRYGEIPADAAAVSLMTERWQRVRVLMRASSRSQPRELAVTASTQPAALLEQNDESARWNLSALRARIHAPEPEWGATVPSWRRSLGLAVISLVAPIVIMLLLLILLATLSHFFNGKGRPHSLGTISHSRPAAGVRPAPRYVAWAQWDDNGSVVSWRLRAPGSAGIDHD